jgi:hypothetical protein
VVAPKNPAEESQPGSDHVVAKEKKDAVVDGTVP